MSTVRARETFHHEGGTVVGGAELDAADPVALAFAPLFEAVEDGEGPRRRGRPPGSRNKPKDMAEDGSDG